MTKFPIDPKNLIFGPFAPFLGQNFFFLNPALSCTATHKPLTPRWVSEKTNEPIPRKLPDRKTNGRKDQSTEGKKDWRMVRP